WAEGPAKLLLDQIFQQEMLGDRGRTENSTKSALWNTPNNLKLSEDGWLLGDIPKLGMLTNERCFKELKKL
ncbi:hypothetical protein, partial [Roseibacillus persicicus]|uniref:hypothetical protein n=1 Tax=Roseibacillus persicicus TaxID=454148 RepID=UPI00280F3A9F